MRSCAVLILAMVATSSTLGQQDSVSESARVEALLSGLEGYEQSFESVGWKQEYYIPPNARKHLDHWLKLEESERYGDRSRRWFMHISMVHIDPPDFVQKYDVSRQFGDGAIKIAANDASPDRGIQADIDGFFQGGASLLSLQGRFVEYGDFTRGRLLSQVMRGGTALVYLPPTADEPWPGVRSEGSISQGWTDVEVRLDPEREFMPCLIRPMRRHDGAVAEVIQVMASQRVNGISVPTRGFRAMKALQIVDDPEHPISPESFQDFAAARSMVGLESVSPPIGEEERRFIDDFLHVREVDPSEHVFEGPLDWRNPAGNLIVPILLDIHDVTLNEPRDLAAMFHDLPAGTKFLTSFTYRWESVEEFERHMSEWGTSGPGGTE